MARLVEVDEIPQQKSYKLVPVDERSWSDVPIDAVKNIPSSALNLASGLASAVMHPIDTASNLLDVGAGGLRAVMPSGVQNVIDRMDNPEANQRVQSAASNVGQFYKNRYGSMEGLKETLATDPVGAAADLSTVLAGGAAVTAKLPALSRDLQRAAAVTNPLNAVAPIAKSMGRGVANVLGSPVSTGVGSEAVKQAFQSGVKGKKEFIKNLSGEANPTDVLDTMKSNLQQMQADKSAAYRSGMIDIKNDKTVLSFSGVDNALNDTYNMVTFKGKVKNTAAAKVYQTIQKEIDTWKNLNPSEYHTPEGMDALKQKIGGIVDSIPFEEKTARNVGTKIYNSLKTEINNQAPTYSKVMKDYSDATDQIREIEKAFSTNASADTSMRKLQSLMRNNVNTNYGNRLTLAKELEQKGGGEIMPALAGQAMNSWHGRGLGSQVASLGTLGAAAHYLNPNILALMALQSPKAVGLGAYGAGRVAGAIPRLTGVDQIPPELLTTYGLLGAQAGMER